MSSRLPDDQLFDERQSANYIGLKNHRTLAVWRSTKRYDLPYIKVGSAVRYWKSDLDKFLEQRLMY